MKNLQENIVPAANQNNSNFFPFENDGIRILFAGNSVTKHGVKLDIGWERDCGMAASSLENDYVHIIMKKIREIAPNAAYAIAQVADFERKFEDTENDILKKYECAGNFEADIVIMFFGANVADEANAKTFGKRYEDLRNLLAAKKDSKVYTVEGFWIKPALEAEKKAVCQKYGDVYIPLGKEIQESESTHGMHNHPNDLGMKLIADKIFNEIKAEVIAKSK